MVAAPSNRASAAALLQRALDRPLIHGEVNQSAYPHAARSYLDDGSGLAWLVDDEWSGFASFAVDGEFMAPVRPGMQRRFGITDEHEFARLWTRAEVGAKLLNIPILVWLKQHGLHFMASDINKELDAEIALFSTVLSDKERPLVVTFGVLLS